MKEEEIESLKQEIERKQSKLKKLEEEYKEKYVEEIKK